jgi:hypothetical protein
VLGCDAIDVDVGVPIDVRHNHVLEPRCRGEGGWAAVPRDVADPWGERGEVEGHAHVAEEQHRFIAPDDRGHGGNGARRRGLEADAVGPCPAFPHPQAHGVHRRGARLSGEEHHGTTVAGPNTEALDAVFGVDVEGGAPGLGRRRHRRQEGECASSDNDDAVHPTPHRRDSTRAPRAAEQACSVQSFSKLNF